MATALIHMDSKQKQRLAHRAKMRGKSFSQEVRNAVEMYLDVPVEDEAELRVLAKAANQAADRMIKNLDETIAYVGRVLRHKRNGQ
jgi:predicted DNA-binding protein